MLEPETHYYSRSQVWRGLDEGVVTMDLTLRESGILLEGTAMATGEEPIEVGFGRVTEEAIEACPSL